MKKYTLPCRISSVAPICSLHPPPLAHAALQLAQVSAAAAAVGGPDTISPGRAPFHSLTFVVFARVLFLHGTIFFFQPGVRIRSTSARGQVQTSNPQLRCRLTNCTTQSLPGRDTQGTPQIIDHTYRDRDTQWPGETALLSGDAWFRHVFGCASSSLSLTCGPAFGISVGSTTCSIVALVCFPQLFPLRHL